jgi:hypothetical protein
MAKKEVKKHENWGGQRKGAGRPKVLERPNKKIGISISAEVYDWIKTHKSETTSSFIHRVLRERMIEENS